MTKLFLMLLSVVILMSSCKKDSETLPQPSAAVSTTIDCNSIVKYRINIKPISGLITNAQSGLQYTFGDTTSALYTWSGPPAQTGNLDSIDVMFYQKFKGGFVYNLVTDVPSARFKLYRNDVIIVDTIIHGFTPVGAGSNYLFKEARCCGDTLTLGFN